VNRFTKGYAALKLEILAMTEMSWQSVRLSTAFINEADDQ
jgi:hypothetical protein